MPSGLPEVVQPVGADTSKYISEYKAALQVTKELSAANKDLMRSVTDAQNVIKSAGGGGGGGAAGNAGDIAKVNQAIREQLQLLGGHSRAISDVTAGSAAMARAQADAARTIRDTETAVRQASAAMGDLAASHERVRAMTADSGTAVRSHVEDLTRLRSAASDATSAIDDASRSIEALTARAAGAGRATTSILGPELAAALAGGGFFSGGGPYGGGGGGGGGFTPVPPSGGGGDDSYHLRAMMAAATPGDKGTAASMWAPVGSFLSRWLGPAHYVLMGINEIAATVIPAITAAGSAALVGVQGFEQIVPRAQAVFNTAESLGSSLGITTGQAWGLGASPLQNAQDLATGFAPQMMGAGINIVRAGGGGFIQLGQNTLNMVAQGMATLTQEFQHGMGKQISDAASTGTGYLKQFGDILGNVGHLFLNVAPNLPGVGGDYLSILQGATGGLARITGGLGPALGPLLAMEAGGRLGTPLVGGLGSLLGRAGTGIAGLADTLGATSLSGLSAAEIAAVAGETGVSLTAGGGLLARILAQGGVGLAKAGGFLGALGAPEIAGLAAAAFGIGKGFTYQTPEQQTVSGMLGGVNQMGIPQAIPSIIQDMQKLAAVPYSAAPGRGAGANFMQALGKDTGIGQGFNLGGGFTQGWHSLLQAVGIKGADPHDYQAAQSGLQQLAQGFVNVLNTGGQVQQQWAKLGGGAIDMGKAFDVATMAQLQLGNSFEKNGKLTAQAKQMIANLQAGYAPMNMNTGQFGSAVAAQTAMAGLQHTQLAAVNQSYDQLMQVVAGGASGSAALGGLLRAMPAGSGTAMRGFLSPSASAAWTAFASTSQPSVLSQLQSQADWLRTAQTMGALGAGQTAGMAEFLLGKALPSAKGSPAALAMLSTIAQQFGGPSFAPGTSAAQMFRSLSKFAGQGVSAGGYNQLMTRGTESLANIGTDAQQFVQQVGSGIAGAMAQGIATHGATLQDAFMGSVGKGGFSNAALAKYVDFLHGAGTPVKGIQDMAAYAAQLSGATGAQQKVIKWRVQLDVNTAEAAAKAKAALDASSKDHQVTIKAVADVTQAKAQLASVTAGQHVVTFSSRLIKPSIPVLQGLVVYRAVLSGGGTNAQAAFAQSNIGKTGGFQTGGMVPGSGSGDIIPAMLEPGEAIIPRYLVPLIAPILAAHRVPGFGGVPQSSASHFAGGGLVPHVLGFPDPTIQGKAGQFAFTLIDSIAKALNAAGAKKIADALVAQIGKEVALAKNVSSAAMQGQGYGNAGLLGGMDVTPGTGNGSVYDQMQTYLTSVKSFTKDLAALRKDHLAKGIISQLVAAGPVQGDALAQSILGDYRGVKGINQLWSQLGGAAKGLGAQAAMAQYGGHLSPDLKSGSVSIGGISISINAGGGATLVLTDAQIKQVVAKVQAALLKQAKRNSKTGLQLSGKGA